MLDAIYSNVSWKYIPLIVYVAFVSLLYLDRWQAKRKVAALGLSSPDVSIKGPLG